MKILVTGPRSFVGRALLPLLKVQSHELSYLVRAPKGLHGEIVWDFQGGLPEGIPTPTVIIHLAAKPYFGPELDTEQYIVNVLASGALARLAHDTGALMIFASAAIIHGNAPTIGRNSPLDPKCHYAMTKILAEGVIRQWTADHVFLRIGGIYGLDGPSHLGLNRSISAADHHRTVPTLIGSGAARRNYICVEDVAKWIMALVDDKSRGLRPRNPILYLAGPETLSLKDYLTAIARTFTPAQDPLSEAGPEARDFVLEPDAAPFRLTGFSEYLAALKQRKDAHA